MSLHHFQSAAGFLFDSDDDDDDEFSEDIKERVRSDGLLRNEIRTLIKNRDGGWKTNNIMFHKYLHNSELSISKGKVGNRYEGELLPLKKFSTYLYLKGGAYNALQLNSLVPSVTTVKREIVETQRMEIGVIYVEALKEFLTEHEITETTIVCSEDATRLKDEIVYDAQNDQLLGLLPEFNISIGLPKPKNFDASSPSKIIQSLKNYKMAPYVEVIMAKPLKIGRLLFGLFLLVS